MLCRSAASCLIGGQVRRQVSDLSQSACLEGACSVGCSRHIFSLRLTAAAGATSTSTSTLARRTTSRRRKKQPEALAALETKANPPALRMRMPIEGCLLKCGLSAFFHADLCSLHVKALRLRCSLRCLFATLLRCYCSHAVLALLIAVYPLARRL